ncbi:hypothetical protein V8C34DRAFT_317028 [Trichoderma compactum]
MAEAIGIASGLLACLGPVRLPRVRELAEEAGALSEVLGSLVETQIKKVSSRSTGTRTSLRDWAKLQYMGEDMDGFRRLLAGYKMTITIALTDANLRWSAATAEYIEGDNDLICSAREQFEDPDADQGGEIEHGKESRHYRPAVQSHRRTSSQVCERSHREHGRLTRMAAKLKEHERFLFNRLTEKMKASSSTPEEAADIARLREEWESTFESMNILSKAGSYFERKTSVIENHATGDAHRIMVATDEKTLHGTNRGLGWRSRRIGGRMNDETVRRVSRDMVTVTIRNVYDEQPSERKGTPMGPADREPVGRHTEFHERYGEGFKVTSMK